MLTLSQVSKMSSCYEEPGRGLGVTLVGHFGVFAAKNSFRSSNDQLKNTPDGCWGIFDDPGRV